MSSEKMVIFGICALLACLQHGVALPPGFGPVNTPTLSPSPSPSPLALPAPSPSSSPIGSVASPFGDTLFSLPADRPKESTATRVSRNEGDIEDIETRVSVLESSFDNMTITQTGTEVDIVTLRTDVESLQSQMSSVATSITSIQATAAAPSPATDYTADIAGLNAGLEGVVSDLASARSTLESSIAEVEADVTTFQSSMTNTEQRGLNNEIAISEIHAEIDGLSSRVDNAVTFDTVDEIDVDLDNLDARINTLELQGGSIPSQTDIDSLAARVGGLENTQNTFDTSAIDALQDQVTVLESAVDEVSGRTENMESSYSTKLSEQDTKIDESSASLLDLMNQLAETRAEIGTCQTEGGCDDIHTMIERMKTQAAEIEALVQSASASSTENTAFIGENKVKMDGMEVTIGDLQSQLDAQAASQTASSSLQAIVDGIIVDVAGLQEDGASTTSSVTTVQAEIGDHAASIVALQSEVTGLQSIVDDMVTDIAAASSASSDLETTLTSSVENLKVLVDDLSDTVDSMIEDVDTSCNYPWSYRSSVGTCIYTAYGVKAYWIDAKAWCESYGKNYRLYKVDTKAKQSDLVSYINYYIWDFYNDYLVGFYALSSQQYQWTDGSKEFDQSAWCYGEPNNWGHGCGSLWNGSGLCLDDVNCDAFNQFICEKIIS